MGLVIDRTAETQWKEWVNQIRNEERAILQVITRDCKAYKLQLDQCLKQEQGSFMLFKDLANGNPSEAFTSIKKVLGKVLMRYERFALATISSWGKLYRGTRSCLPFCGATNKSRLPSEEQLATRWTQMQKELAQYAKMPWKEVRNIPRSGTSIIWDFDKTHLKHADELLRQITLWNQKLVEVVERWKRLYQRHQFAPIDLATRVAHTQRPRCNCLSAGHLRDFKIRDYRCSRGHQLCLFVCGPKYSAVQYNAVNMCCTSQKVTGAVSLLWVASNDGTFLRID